MCAKDQMEGFFHIRIVFRGVLKELDEYIAVHLLVTYEILFNMVFPYMNYHLVHNFLAAAYSLSSISKITYNDLPFALTQTKILLDA